MSTESSLDVPDFVMNPENSAKHVISVFVKTHHDYLESTFQDICEAMYTACMHVQYAPTAFDGEIVFGYTSPTRSPTTFEQTLLVQWLNQGCQGWASVLSNPSMADLYIQVRTRIPVGPTDPEYDARPRIPCVTPPFVSVALAKYSPKAMYTRAYRENRDDACALFEVAMENIRTHLDMPFFPDETFTSKSTYSFLCNIVTKWLGQLGWTVAIQRSKAWEISVDTQ